MTKLGYKIVYKRSFDIKTAGYNEWFELWHTRKGLFGRIISNPVCTHHPETFSIPYRGDLAWAKRIARHYCIELPSLFKIPKK